MSINLGGLLDLDNLDADELSMLNDIQANMLKGHGREHTVNIFLNFDTAHSAIIKNWINNLPVMSAGQQFCDIARYKKIKEELGQAEADRRSPSVLLFFLSASGYAALEVPEGKVPEDALFRAGQKSRQPDLADPPVENWDDTYQSRVDAMLLIGGTSAGQAASASDTILATLPTGVTVLGSEIGLAYRNRMGDGVEHFGYVDGRSQPLFLVADVEAERSGPGVPFRWDPAFPLSQVLVKDPGSEELSSFGSYFVFRKLEQNVKGFKDREEDLRVHLNFPEGSELAGALLVGRFEDGTPVVLQDHDGLHPVPNDFDYTGDMDGMKCPFHAHIRKTNPRGETSMIGGPLDFERSHIMARRGITYGERVTEPAGQTAGVEFLDQPTGGVGLLFMAYQNDIANQFEFTQIAWANNADFLLPGTGIDPVIGQGGTAQQVCPLVWGGNPATDKAQPFDFAGFVTTKGGEYFFAPSLSTLKSI